MRISLSDRRTATIYKVTQSSLSNRRAKMPSRHDTVSNLRKLTQSEETIIVWHILNLNARGFSPQLAAVADIANSLRAGLYVGYVSVK
jgi:hypothetical protein